MTKNIILLAGSATFEFAKKVANNIEIKNKDGLLSDINLTKFSDGEIKPQIMENIRNKDVFVIQSTYQPINNFHELLLIGDAVKRASAKSITAVIPYYGYGRQDRKDAPRVPITSKLHAKFIEAAGFQRVIFMDLHAGQIQGFFECPVDNLYASIDIIKYIERIKEGKDFIMVSPDAGGTKRAEKYAKFLGVDMAVCYKSRSGPNEIKKMRLLGDVTGKDVILIDDIVDTAGTIVKAANIAMESGARSVRAISTHPVMSGDAYEKIENSAIVEFVVCDTVPIQEGRSTKIKVISVAKTFADAIVKVQQGESLSNMFFENKSIN